MDALAQGVVWLNAAANALGRIVLPPIMILPGWLSATIIAMVSGVALLLIFKHTSNQSAIKRIRDGINADLLALKLFKENTPVVLRSQGLVLVGAGRLMIRAIVPILVMLVPVSLLLGQLSLWYDARPLRPGEDAVVTVRLRENAGSGLVDLNLQPTSGAQAIAGPVQVQSQHELCWAIRARETGYQELVFQSAGESFSKQLAVGEGFWRVSKLRPSWDWRDALMNPAETPFGPDSLVQSIAIDYPLRESWTSGTGSWLIYWFVMSMVAGFCFRRWLNVNV